ncbi:MAG: 30S ribosomal protein S16 [Okeania sp. SIO1H6]|uniref:Small ribosomal subunit protein bS16 n=1 Tax=Okeania hirsuta TaxID=1458930 RepID=A0A3N6P2Z2_9CYAN|nr:MULTISPECIES: 30S ribosomal protein S16 [unclassified Okeania]NEP05033.1 30S ribosomal protein S16 [Okeania sp. SIO4D6]NEP37990.1 30S ribosomal protein S16 [Okeania sp. SIO2H7]NET12694.1 30S ribosomal protein S16 [Okeania sp. SIO1H6]RQH16617.1 30S ribosomal protein S16 [Okeania hirsuta]NEP71220.1 30S ribosomal protein S16 [Okeania sp. SIO2G5]
MIKLRLKKYGKKRETSYRIVAMNSSSRRDGRPLEELGFYNPRTDETRLDVPGITRRLEQGAQPTQTVRDILRKANVLESPRTGINTQENVSVSHAESTEAIANNQPSEETANTEASQTSDSESTETAATESEE